MVEIVNFKAIYVIVIREFKRFLRQKSRVIASLARPLLWLFVIGSGFAVIVKGQVGISYNQFILPGIIGMTVLFSSIFSAVSIVWDREFGFLREMLVAPISRFTLVLGRVLSGTLLSLLQALIIMLCIPVLGLRPSILQLLLLIFFVALLSFAMAAMGILIASRMESLEGFSVVMNFIVMPMFFLSGAIYPVKVLPPFMQTLAKFNPFTYGIDALKNILFDMEEKTPFSPDFGLLTDFIVIILFSVLMLLLASLSFEKKD